MSENSITNWFTLLSTLLACVFFGFALFISVPPWTDLFLGMATSFVFLAVTNTIVRLQRWWSFRRIRAFFGAEIATDGLLLAYPDFELSEVAQAKLKGVQEVWRRPSINPGEGVAFPTHEFPMEIKTSVAANDIQALLFFASVVEQNSSVAAALILDREIWLNSRRSFCAAGLTSNHCVELYSANDRDPIFTLSQANGHPLVKITSGPTVENNEQREFGIIFRYCPDIEKFPNRRWWYLAGLGAAGTPGSARYLATEWRKLSAMTQPESDMLAVVSLPVGNVGDPRLEYVLERPPNSQERRVLFNSGYIDY